MIRIPKAELLAEYNNRSYTAHIAFPSFSQYQQYAQCVSGLCVGDNVELCLWLSSTRSRSTKTISAVVIATGHMFGNILLGRETVGNSFYTPAHDILLAYKHRAKNADKSSGVFYIRARKDIQAVVRKIIKVKDAQ